MPKFTGSIAKYPARASIYWYAAIIAAGAVLLCHPLCRVAEIEGQPVEPISVIDAVFTSASAACVTGLTVRSTGNEFSFLGQAVILLLIQIGGIGIMTITTYATFGLSGMPNLRHRAVMAESLGSREQDDLRWVLRNVILLSLVCEAIGFMILGVRNLVHLDEFTSIGHALWHALFHAVSAFCNAGFAMFDASMVRYADDVTVNLTLIALIIVGGIGFPVWLDLIRNWHGKPGEIWRRLALHSKLMLLGSAALILFGFVSFLVLEWRNLLAPMPWPQKLLVSLFQSVTCRTAGFNTVEISSLTNASLFIAILLMIIGAGPCSTAGGLKVSTFLTLVLRGWCSARGARQISLFGRSIKRDTVDQATTTALLFGVVAIVAITLLLVIDQSEMMHSESQGMFLEAVFEVISALGTVGLSMGLTGQLTFAGKVIIILLMFIGRLGPISVGVAISRSVRDQPVTHPYEEPLIG